MLIIYNKVPVLAYKCQHNLAPTNLCDELRRPAGTEARRRLRSVSSTSLDVRRTRLSTVGNRARFLLHQTNPVSDLHVTRTGNRRHKIESIYGTSVCHGFTCGYQNYKINFQTYKHFNYFKRPILLPLS